MIYSLRAKVMCQFHLLLLPLLIMALVDATSYLICPAVECKMNHRAAAGGLFCWALFFGGQQVGWIGHPVKDQCQFLMALFCAVWTSLTRHAADCCCCCGSFLADYSAVYPSGAAIRQCFHTSCPLPRLYLSWYCDQHHCHCLFAEWLNLQPSLVYRKSTTTKFVDVALDTLWHAARACIWIFPPLPHLLLSL